MSKNKLHVRPIFLIALIAALVLAVIVAVGLTVRRGSAAGNTTGYAWGENIGWVNFGTAEGEVVVGNSSLSGYAWGENIGWVSLSCGNDGTCGTVDYKVANNGGVLSGYAWGENIGWISFSCENNNSCSTVEYRARISNGAFSGYAWGENIGWISFSCGNTNTCGTVNYSVATAWAPTSSSSKKSTVQVVADIAPVTDLKADTSSGQAHFTWTDPASKTISNIALYCGKSGEAISGVPVAQINKGIMKFTWDTEPGKWQCLARSIAIDGTNSANSEIVTFAVPNVVAAVSESGVGTGGGGALFVEDAVEADLHLAAQSDEQTPVAPPSDFVPSLKPAAERHWAVALVDKLASKNIIPSSTSTKESNLNRKITRIEYVDMAKAALGDYAFSGKAPDSAPTRAEAIKIAFDAVGADPAGLIDYSFTDIGQSEWYAPYVAIARKNNIVNGYGDGTFRPNNPITYAEAVKIIVKTMEIK